MRRHSFIVTVAAGALALGACKQEQPVRNPPVPQPETLPSTLPSWDDVPSGHPEGATNPPIPNLVVKPDGSCFKLWRSPMLRVEPSKTGEYVDPDCVAEACGTQIQCPDSAAGVLEAWKKAQEGG